MSRETILARNRQNALKSTGPRTARGKAAVAGNARRHGATSRPDPETVATWLAIILDDPVISLQTFLPPDDRGVRALTLAQAETRLLAAEHALHEFEAGREPLSEDLADVQNLREHILEVVRFESLTIREERQGDRLLMRIHKVTQKETAIGGQRHRLLIRYAREARAQRRRAFSAWLDMMAPAGSDA